MADPEIVVPVVEVSPPTETPPELDYKALLETERTARIQVEERLRKQGADYSALRGTVRSQAARDAEWANRFDSLTQQVATIAKVGGEDIQQEAAIIQQQGETARQQTAFEAEWVALNDELKAVLIVDDKPVLALGTAPELDAVRDLYRQAREAPNLSGEARLRLLERATRLAERAVLQQRSKITDPVVAPVTVAAAPIVKPKVPPMEIGGAGATAVISDEEYVKEYGKSAQPFGKPADHQRVKKYWDSKK